MSYSKIDVLENAWSQFEKILKSLIDPSEYHLSEIQKIMTAESVVDLSNHAIYIHAEYLHCLTSQLLNLRKNNPDNGVIINICQQWTALLKNRNEHPLKILHHKRLDAECTFDFSLQLMEDKPYGFKEIQILDSNNQGEFNKAITVIKRLDCLAQGVNFGDLPLVGDAVLSSLLRYKDTICFIAKNNNDEIIGYSWGIMLRDLSVGEKNKVNVFWVMDLAKHPDFYDPRIKVGTVLRQYIADTMKAKSDCHFLGYQHVLDHKFHLSIIDGLLPTKQEKINLGQDQYHAASELQFDTFNYFHKHFVRSNNHQHPFPQHDVIRPALFSAFWSAADSVKDFMLGGAFFYSRTYYQHWTHSMLEQPVQYRIEEPVSKTQQIRDMSILKRIILTEEWGQQGTTLFFDSCIPKTIKGLQHLVADDQNDYSILKQYVANSGLSIARSKLTTYFYFVISQNDNPTNAINMLISNSVIPKKWIELISAERQSVQQYKVVS